MRPVLRLFFSSVVTVVASSSALSATQLPPLPEQKTPFAAAKQSKIKQFKTKMVDDSFIAGSKSLKVDRYGAVSYTASGQQIATIYLPLRLTNAKGRTIKYLGTNHDFPEEYFKDKSPQLEHTKDGFKFTKVIINNGEEARLYGQIKMLADGRVEFFYKWDDFKSGKFHISPYSIMLDTPIGIAGNSAYSVDGKAMRIPEKPSQGIIYRVKHFKNIMLFADRPGASLDIAAGKGCKSFQIMVQKRLVKFRIYPKGGSFSIIVDFRRGLEDRASADKYAGIDFIKTDDLPMPDYSASTNLVPNPSFERGFECYWHFSTYCRQDDMTKLNWLVEPFILDKSEARFGTNSLKMLCSSRQRDYRWIGYHIRTFLIPLSKGKYTFSLYAKGEKKRQRLSVWIPNVKWLGNPHLPLNYKSYKQRGVTKVFYLTTEWKRYTISFDVPSSIPVHFSFGSDSLDGKGKYIWVDGLQLEKGGRATAFKPRPVESCLVSSAKGNFLNVGDKIDAKLLVTSTPNTKGKVNVSIKNYFGNDIFKYTTDFSCNARGKAVLPLPLEGKLPQGIFVVKSEYELPDGKKLYDLHRLSIMKFLEGKHRLKKIFAENYGRPWIRADFLQLLERYRQIGIGSTSELRSWDKKVWDTFLKYDITPTDAYTFTHVDRKSVPADSLRWVISDPVSQPHLKPDDPSVLLGLPRFDANGNLSKEYLADLKKSVAKVVREHPWIPVWLGGNETFAMNPVIRWSKKGTREKGFENLARFQKAFQEGVKEGNPKAKTLSDEPCNMNPDHGIKELGEQLAALKRIGGQKFDYIGIHPYRATPESPDADADMECYIKMMEANGYAGTPVFWSEGMHYGPYTIPQWGIISAAWSRADAWYYGALSYGMSWTEKISAAWRARTWLVALKYQDLVKVAMSGAQGNNFEMDVDLTPYATQKMPNTLANLLGNAYFKKDIRFAPYIRCYVFEDEKKRPVAAVWSHHPKLDAGKMSSPVAGVVLGDKVDAVFDLMQQQRAYTPDKNGYFEFPVTSFPAFFRGKPGTLNAFINAFDHATLVRGEDISPVAIVAKPVSPTMSQVKARNYLSKPFDCTVIAPSGASAKLSVPASGLGETMLKLPEKLSYGKLSNENLQLTFKTAKGQFASDAGFDGLLCRQTDKTYKLDCDLNAWKDIPAVEIRSRIISRGIGKVGNKDLSAWFKVAWSEKGLNLLVNVTDDKFVHEKMKKNRDRWRNDCLQLYIDTLCEARWRTSKGYGETEYDYAVFPSPDGKKAETFRFRQPDPQLSGLATDAPRDNAMAPEIPSAFKLTKKGYIYQVFIPAKYLLPVKLEKGYALGFAMLVSDRDDQNNAAKGKRESSLSITPRGTEPWNNPKQWPVLLLWK